MIFNNFYEYISYVSFENINNLINIIKNLLNIFFNINLEQKYIVNKENKCQIQYENLIDDEKCEWGWFIFIDD